MGEPKTTTLGQGTRTGPPAPAQLPSSLTALLLFMHVSLKATNGRAQESFGPSDEQTIFSHYPGKLVSKTKSVVTSSQELSPPLSRSCGDRVWVRLRGWSGGRASSPSLKGCSLILERETEAQKGGPRGK